MPQTYTKLVYHVVFATKDRRPFIDDEIRQDLQAYLGGIIRSLNGKPLVINGTGDHVHILMALSPTVALSEVMRAVKANSSKWIHEKWPAHDAFAWQAGYAAFTVSQSVCNDVYQYIAAQEKHHQKLTFDEEFTALLKRHEIDYDPAFVSR